jgi:hypothetical protein
VVKEKKIKWEMFDNSAVMDIVLLLRGIATIMGLSRKRAGAFGLWALDVFSTNSNLARENGKCLFSAKRLRCQIFGSYVKAGFRAIALDRQAGRAKKVFTFCSIPNF